jgi:hypothetical protein
MKKAIFATLGVIAIFSIFLAGTVSAFKAGYEVGNCQGVDITADGVIGEGEWYDDSFGDWLYDGWTKTDDTIHIKYEFGGTPTIADQWLINVLTDTTNDPGDVFTFCFCGAQDDASSPQNADDVLINYTRSGTTIYRGTGSGWAVDPEIVLGENVVIGSSMASGHWIIELKFDTSGNIAGTLYDSNVRLAVYDASTGKTLMWPPMSEQDVPSTYGLCNYSGYTDKTVPEGLTLGVMLALSSVAAVVSIRYFRKPTKL